MSWTEFFTWLNRRGLGGVDYVTSDNHEGLNLALGKTLPHVVDSRCQTHFSRNLLEEVCKKDQFCANHLTFYPYTSMIIDIEERLRAYCQLQGLEILDIVREEGVSASKPLGTRPGGARVVRLWQGRKPPTW